METKKIILKRGGTLCFAQSGDDLGKPVFFFHGTPGSRLFHPPDEVTKKHGIRLISIDRPGYGESTFQPGRRILDWSSDIVELAEHLGIQNFHVTGHSGGGPYVLACSYANSNRVISASIISSVGPGEAITTETQVSTVNRLGFKYGRYLPWIIWKVLILLIYRQRSQDPWSDIDRQAPNRPNADADLIKLPEIRNNCWQSEVEAFKPGLRGLAWDARLITRPWGVQLEEIKVPVSIWHGSEDNQAPPAMAHYLASKIPACSERILQGEAHLLIFKYWEDILIDLLRVKK
jgi:pimeloyl-ACP methyl ester carboxylesterase